MKERPNLSGVLGSLPWPIAESFSAILTGAVTVFLIARIIGADEFGRSSIALGVILVMLVGVNSLVHDALVRMPEMQPEDLDAGFTASLAVSIGFAALAIMAAPYIGSIFQDSRVGLLVWGFVPLLPLSALSETLNAQKRRALDFRTVAQNQIAGRVLGSIVGIAAAWKGAGAWSLVAQYIVIGAFTAGGMLARTDRWPRLRFSWDRVAPMLGFCSPIIASQLLTQGTGRLVLMGMGHWHGIAFAGYWGVATRISESAFGGLIQAAYNVGLAHFSLQQHARDQLAASLKDAQAVAVLFAVPVLAGLAAAAEPLVLLLLGDEWRPVSLLMLGPLLGSYLLVRRIFVTTALRVIGRSGASLVASMVEGATILVALLLFASASPFAFPVLIPAGVLAGFVPLFILLAREFRVSSRQQLLLIARDVAIGAAAYALGRQVIGMSPVQSHFADVLAAGATAFLIAAALLAASEARLVRSIIAGLARRPAGLGQ